MEGFRKIWESHHRIIFDPPVEPGNPSAAIVEALVEMGCDYEGANPRYIVVNIPSAVNFHAVVEYLIENNIQFEHADPTYNELYPNE